VAAPSHRDGERVALDAFVKAAERAQRLTTEAGKALARASVLDSALPYAHVDVPSTRAGIAKTEAWLRTDGIAASIAVTGERAVLPLIYGRGDFTAQLVDVLDARAGLERWTVYATSDGTPLLRVSQVAHGTGTGRQRTPGFGQAQRAGGARQQRLT